MYASQTKRLCVRGGSSDDNRVHHHSSSSTSSEAKTPSSTSIESTATTTNHQHLTRSILLTSPTGTSLLGPVANVSVEGAMTATGAIAEVEYQSESLVAPASPSHHDHNRQQTLTTKEDQIQKTNAEIDLINQLANETLEETKLELLVSIRNLVTACNKKKDLIVSHPSFNKIINLIDDVESDGSNRSGTSSSVKTQLALLLCSVAKSGEHNIKILNESLLDGKIFNLILSSQDETLIEACLRCMRSIMSWPRVARTWLLYETQANHKNISIENSVTSRDQTETSPAESSLQKLIAFARNSKSIVVQECVADIFANTCTRNKDQVLLYRASALSCIVLLLESPSNRVVIASLNWLIQLCLKNHLISSEIIKAHCPSGTPVLDRLTILMSKDNCHELQFLSARCFAYIYRALDTNELRDDPRIINNILPALVRMVHRDKAPYLRIKSAECIAYLIEREKRLQSTASVCDHLIESLAHMLEYENNSILSDSISCTTTHYRSSSAQDRGVSWLSISAHTTLDLRPTQPEPSKQVVHCDGSDGIEMSQDMKRAAFLALAALASELEPIRKKIFTTCSVMQHLVKSLTDNCDTKTLKSVLTCLLSLSRSVQQLRTSFAENSVYIGLKNLLSTTSNDVLILVLAILCNISLDFSPGKHHFLDLKTIDTLCNFTRRSDPVLRYHGMWVLMNMVYQLKELNLKYQILRSLGVEYVLSLLEIEGDDEIVMKTLGFLRNLLSQKLHIDALMNGHGEQIIQALEKILARPCSKKIKEQTLCVLTNIADGNESKTFIMNCRPVLDYLARTMEDEKAGDLRIAAILCITNLAHKDYERSQERRTEMNNKFKIEEKLKLMLNTNDPNLSDKVRTAYNQFLMVDDKYVS